MNVPEAYRTAIGLLNGNRLREAEDLLQRLRRSQPGFGPAAYTLGKLLLHTRRGAEAVPHLAAATAADPRNADVATEYLRALSQTRRYDEALAFAAALPPAVGSDWRVRYNVAVVLARHGRTGEAAASLRSLLVERPALAAAAIALANCLAQIGDFDGARLALRRAAAVEPASPELQTAWVTLGRAANDLDMARHGAERGLALDPGGADATFALADVLMTAGDYRAGFAAYEARLRRAVSRPATQEPVTSAPWHGGRVGRLLVHAEQGFGDTLQFCRFLPMAETAAERRQLHVQPGLGRLMQRSFPAWAVSEMPAPLPAHDAHAFLMSLPHILEAGMALTPPPAEPYLLPCPKLAAAWRGRLGSDGGPAVGIVWAGSPTHTNDRNRSLSFDRLAPLTELAGIRLFSLQKGPAAQQAGTLAPERRLGDGFASFDDTAAAVSALDLVISIDSAVAHLAGGLGKPVWLMLPFSPDWRWGIFGDRTPWYPRMRIFRQPAPGAWEPVVQAVAAVLRELPA